MPRLYVVATPIGNLSDMTPRAIETLKSVDLIAAEDTRVTRALLNHFGIDTPTVSNHQHNEEHRASPLIEKMLEENLNMAVVTDAGTPCISDPGSVLVREAAAAGVEVLAVPGPTAMASALSVSGFDTREFAFYGFLPRGKKELREIRETYADPRRTEVVPSFEQIVIEEDKPVLYPLCNEYHLLDTE